MIVRLIRELKDLEDKCQDEGRINDMARLDAMISFLEEEIRQGADKQGKLAGHYHEARCDCERCPHCNEVL